MVHLVRFPTYATKIILDHNMISYITSGSFKGLRHLEQLSLQHNNISDIPEDAFIHLTHLQTLILDTNFIKRLPERLFEANTKLSKLSIQENELTYASLNASLYHLPNMVDLNLEANKFYDETQLPPGFAELRKLKYLELGANDGIRNITSGYFEYLEGLPIEYLGLGYCPILHVDKDALLNLPTLQQMDLSYTEMRPGDVKHVFYGIENSTIEMLYLSYVFVYSEDVGRITDDMFEPLQATNLKVLTLEGNYDGFGGAIHNNFFQHVRHLHELNLDNNQLHTIGRDAFKGLHKLKKLNLQRNFINCLTDCSFITYGATLKSLIFLDLTDNVITSHNNNAQFRGNVFPKLRTLILKNNRIEVLQPGMFDQLGTLKVLDLTENHLHTIEPGTFQSLHSLHKLFIQESKHLRILSNGTFRGLRNLHHLALNDNQIESIHPRAFHGLKRLEILELNGNRLGGQGSQHFNIPTETKAMRILDLGNNRIEFIPNSLLSIHPHLEKLILHYNRITYLDASCLHNLKKLDTLDLSHNDIMEPVQNSFDGLQRLRTLDLAGNPFLCTCDLKGFVDWLREAELQLTSKSKHMCLGPSEMRGTLLTEFRPSSWECRVKVIVIPILSVMGTLAIVFSVCMLYCKMMMAKKEISSEDNRSSNQRGRNCSWMIRELLPMNGDITPSSDEANPEDPLITESPGSEVST